MYTNSETNYLPLLTKKPYITKRELTLVLGKSGQNLDKKIMRLLRKKSLILLKKGFYADPSYVALQKGRVEEYLANILYYPSYLSLEYVLSKEGLIPEAVYAYTSITTKVTRTFTNSIGTFIYRNIKPELFTGYNDIRFSENYRIKMATKAKALFDFLYLKPLKQTKSAISQELFEDLRINWDNFSKTDKEELSSYIIRSNSRKMKLIGKELERELV